MPRAHAPSCWPLTRSSRRRAATAAQWTMPEGDKKCGARMRHRAGRLRGHQGVAQPQRRSGPCLRATKSAARACAIVLAAYEVIKASRSHSGAVDHA